MWSNKANTQARSLSQNQYEIDSDGIIAKIVDDNTKMRVNARDAIVTMGGRAD